MRSSYGLIWLSSLAAQATAQVVSAGYGVEAWRSTAELIPLGAWRGPICPDLVGQGNSPIERFLLQALCEVRGLRDQERGNGYVYTQPWSRWSRRDSNPRLR